MKKLLIYLHATKYLYLCIIKQKNKMIQNFTYILLCGIIILLAKFSGSECCA